MIPLFFDSRFLMRCVNVDRGSASKGFAFSQDDSTSCVSSRSLRMEEVVVRPFFWRFTLERVSKSMDRTSMLLQERFIAVIVQGVPSQCGEDLDRHDVNLTNALDSDAGVWETVWDFVKWSLHVCSFSRAGCGSGAWPAAHCPKKQLEMCAPHNKEKSGGSWKALHASVPRSAQTVDAVKSVLQNDGVAATDLEANPGIRSNKNATLQRCPDDVGPSEVLKQIIDVIAKKNLRECVGLNRVYRMTSAVTSLRLRRRCPDTGIVSFDYVLILGSSFCLGKKAGVSFRIE